MRLPGYSKPKNGEIVVFNYPDGDTVAVGFQDMSYYQLARYIGYQNIKNPKYRPDFAPDRMVGEIVARPIDKREHYVKRCVGIAGDKLEVRDGDIYINDRKQAMPEHAQHFYMVKTSSHLFDNKVFDPETGSENYVMNEAFLDNNDIYVEEARIAAISRDTVVYVLNMPKNVAEKIKEIPGVISVIKEVKPKGMIEPSIFPHNPSYAWNNDNFGPFTLPSEGMTVKIDTGNICLYEKMLSTYDDGIHHITKSGAQVLYDGMPITSYTFKQGYYWMMGDNRHNSADSRSWGVVPFDHIVGRPVFVWFSMKDPAKNPISGKSILGSLTKNSHDGKFRWERFMCYVGPDGLVSWKIPVAIFVILAFGYNYWSKKRREKKEKKK
jgi:signal peptidase I